MSEVIKYSIRVYGKVVTVLYEPVVHFNYVSRCLDRSNVGRVFSLPLMNSLLFNDISSKNELIVPIVLSGVLHNSNNCFRVQIFQFFFFFSYFLNYDHSILRYEKRYYNTVQGLWTTCTVKYLFFFNAHCI